MTDNQSTLIASLLDPRAYPHAVANLELLETHISWVILTGPYAYKIKKALRLDFLDFSTLALRRHFCEEELRLNRRWAPELYLEVVPIGGSYGKPSIGEDGNAIEYALKMVQFDQDAQLDNQLDAGLLQPHDMYDLAETVAGYHGEAQKLEFISAEDSIEKVRAPMLENFGPLQQATDLDLLQHVKEWTEQNLRDLEPVLIERRKEGFVRECHGDLHLANLVRLHSGIVAFDCVEFSAGLRNIDVISDIAFLVMDLVARARQDLAYTFLNRYLECTGDYSGMAVFGLYFVYHSMIRAKVAAIRSTERSDTSNSEHDIEQLKHNLAVAVRWIDRAAQRLIAMHGYSGSGKTWTSSHLMSELPAIRVRSDVERKRRRGLDEFESAASKPGEGIYTGQARTEEYKNLLEVGEQLLDARHDVIVDASFLRLHERELVEALADKKKVALVYVDTSAGNEELVRRLQIRRAARKQASDAGTPVLEYQYENSEALNDSERERTVFVASELDVDIGDVIKRINRKLETEKR